ncbi:MAG: hypothetical protein JST11_07190 [Acidobacteria bacterium]|nr:hypothetical protein [Acidobacteriota bacterium]
MDIRYMGFDQQQNARIYRFDVVEKGHPAKRCLVSVDVSLFLRHHVALQDGPTLSASKLAADIEKNFDGSHELTDQDLREHTAARLQAEAARAEKRSGRRPSPTSPAVQQQRANWRNFGI